MFPDEFEHAVGEVVTAGAAGGGLMGTSTLLLSEQPGPFDVVTFRVTLPLEPAVYVIVCEVAPLVITPFAIDHE